METVYSTGNQTVDQLGKLEITGNVIPSAWYRTICRETGKPYLNAIVILSDIVYWYRPMEIRDEGSGRTVGYRKRFKSDLLQRSYQQIADQFGITKRDATNAVIALEKLGVVKRVFRTMELNGQTVPNVLFLALDAGVLEHLTFPERYPDGDDGKESAVPVQADREDRWHEESSDPQRQYALNGIREEGGTAEMKEVSGPYGGCHLFGGDIPPKPVGGAPYSGDTSRPDEGEDPTEMGGTNTENTYRDYPRDHPILSYQTAKEGFERQIEYDLLVQDRDDRAELDELVRIAADVLTSSAETIRVNRENRDIRIVQEHYRRLRMFHIQYVLDSLKESPARARNIRAVLVTALYNAADTMDCYYTNRYQSREAEGRLP